MYKQSDIAVVVPCYNEEHRLQTNDFVKELSKNPNLTILFVNDGSRDNTLKVIQKICRYYPERALYISLDKNSGKGEAVRRGMLHLLENDSYHIIGFWDADLAVPLSELWGFVDVFRQNPTVHGVIGSRVHLAGRMIERVNLRHYIGRIFATVICLTFDLSIYDTQCGAKLFDRKVLLPVIQEPFSSRWIFDVELIVRISKLSLLDGKKHWLSKDSWLYEVSVKEWRNVTGTKRSVSAYITAIRDYLRLVRRYAI